MNFLDYFNVKESYQIPDKLLQLLLSDATNLFDLYSAEHLLEKDDLLLDFQLNDASRDSLKQDFTPDGIAEVTSQLLKAEFASAADLCAGTGVLTIKLWKRQPDAFFHCEEFSERTVPYLLFNLGVRNIQGEVLCGDSLSQTYKHVYKLTKGDKYSHIHEVDSYEQRQYDTVISNPPYSLKWDRANQECYKYGLAPAKAADYAFVQYGLSLLKEDGKCAFILPHGVLFRGNDEAKIRQGLLTDKKINAIVGLPSNCFECTSIPVCILVLQSKKVKDLLFIDASHLCEKQQKHNVVTEAYIKQIVDLYHKRESKERLSFVATQDDIERNEYNLNIPRYVDTFELEQVQSLDETLNELADIEQALVSTTRRLMQDLLCLQGYSKKEKEALHKWIQSHTQNGALMNEVLQGKYIKQEVAM